MTQDDMVKVARECGIGLAYGRESIERFYTFVAAAEREACAAACEARKIIDPEYEYDRHYNQGAEHCAFAIRARNKQEQPR